MGSTLTQGQWSHLAVVFTGTQATFYVNGTVRSAARNCGEHRSTRHAAPVGRRCPAGQYLRGSIDDVRLYNRTQTQAEVQADMNTPLVSPGRPGCAVRIHHLACEQCPGQRHRHHHGQRR